MAYAQDPFDLLFEFREPKVSYDEVEVEIVIENRGFSDEPLQLPVVAYTEWDEYKYETEPITREPTLTSIFVPISEGISGAQVMRIEIDPEEISSDRYRGTNIFEAQVDVSQRPLIEDVHPNEFTANEDEELIIFGSNLRAFN